MPTLTLDNSTTLHYTERGRGKKVIVLVHGFPLDCRVWDRVIANPLDGVRIIAPDLPGFGKSKSDRAFTIESLAEDLHHLLLKLNCCPIVLGGLSMGGYVALAYAKRYAMDLRGLMLIDTRAEGDSAEGREKRNKMIALVQERGKDGSKAVADQMMPMLITKQHAGDAKLAGSLREIIESCPPKTIQHAAAAMRDREDQTEFLPSIACPTLIVVGCEDPITPVAAAKSMQAGIAQSKLVEIAGAAHMTCMEKPEELSSAIMKFVGNL